MTIFNFDAHDHISRTVEARVAKFSVQVEYIEFDLGWHTTPDVRGQGHMTRF